MAVNHRAAERRARDQVVDLVNDIVLSLIMANSTRERLTVIATASKTAGPLLMTVFVCDRCQVTATLLGLSRHLNLTEREYQIRTREDGPNAGLHSMNDIRLASDTERLAFHHQTGRR